jgi:sarcosine oxidase subunit gamma
MSLASTGPLAGVLILEAGVRYGVKGARAAAWLAQRGIGVPVAPNRALHWRGSGGGRCLRLGSTEFLVEYDATNAAIPAQAAEDGAYLLLRSDFSLLLDPSWTRALAQACSFDFQRLCDEPEMVVMTLLAGISVTLVREPRPNDAGITLRLWCDASYAPYLQQCLHQLARPAPSPGEQR